MISAPRRPAPTRFIYTALPCEAKPIVQAFGLKKLMDVAHYPIFLNQDLGLVVTGCGKNAMAAGIAYSQALFGARQCPVMLNVGIAGHPWHALGSVFLIDKAIDAEAGKSYYPPLVFTPACATETLQTAARPQLDYRLPFLYDMEATAFFETACRFSIGELAHSLKVVSDNREHPAHAIDAKQANAWIAGNMAVIATTLERLAALRTQLPAAEDEQVEQLRQCYRLTASQRQRLRHLLARLRLLTGERQVTIEPGIANGKELLQWLENRLALQPVVL